MSASKHDNLDGQSPVCSSPARFFCGRTTAFRFLLVMLVLGAAEITSRVYYRLSLGQSFSRTRFADSRKVDPGIKADESVGELWWGAHLVEVIHPYTGYVIDPRRSQGIAVTDLGLIGEISQIQKRAPGKLIVGIFGGSFARHLYTYSRDTLIRAIGADGMDVVVVNVALGGYKQPQQLMTLSWLLALGAEFDVIINIDGFNEVALPGPENIRSSAFPLFPRSWTYRVGNITDSAALPIVARVHVVDRSRAAWAAVFDHFPLHRSAACFFMWRARDRKLVNERVSLILSKQEVVLSGDVPYVCSGPPLQSMDEEALYDYLTDAWVRCSLTMSRLSEAVGAMYLHILQPNQYVPGSKPLSPEEKAMMTKPRSLYRQGVEKGYPSLRSRGSELTAQGVHYYDLTEIFSEVTRTLYIDDCCHLSAEGYDIIAEMIGQTVSRIRNRPAPHSR